MVDVSGVLGLKSPGIVRLEGVMRLAGEMLRIFHHAISGQTTPECVSES